MYSYTGFHDKSRTRTCMRLKSMNGGQTQKRNECIRLTGVHLKIVTVRNAVQS